MCGLIQYLQDFDREHSAPAARKTISRFNRCCIAVIICHRINTRGVVKTDQGRRSMRTLFFVVVILLIAAPVSIAVGQTAQPAANAQGSDPNITANGVIGEVKVIDAAAKQVIIKTDGGSLVTVSLSDKSAYMRLAPGETSLKNATKIAFTEVAEGDRVWARGKVADDHKSVPAIALVVMTKADLAKKQEEER